MTEVRRLWRISIRSGQYEYLLNFDPRPLVGAAWHKCRTRGMTWHVGDIVVSDLVVHFGRIWCGYDTSQKRTYDTIDDFINAYPVKAVLGAQGDDGPYNELPPIYEG